MSVIGLERNTADPWAKFDHSITLIDSSKVRDEELEDDDASAGSTPISRNSSTTPPDRQRNKSHLRKEIAQRKYRKYQDESEPSENSEQSNSAQVTHQAKSLKQGSLGTQGRLRDKIPFRSKKKRHKFNEKDTTFIDVLYENQRGMFLCGIPLYSSNSLLNFDPSAWQTALFQDSVVNITNAQLPDPSWAWAWKTWYVDMSHDVDEEGWEYSFSFANKFVWHGNHPWFHSFCRRRRWLRKRVKAHMTTTDQGRKGRGMAEAHKLNADYFTIHPARRESRGSSADRSDTRRSEDGGSYHDEDEDKDGEPVEIESITALMVAIKKSRIDREKIGAVAQFLTEGGDEIFYLAEKMSFIIGDLIHQTSCRQLQHLLLQSLDDAIKQDKSKANDDDSKGKGKEDTDDDAGSQNRRVQNLLRAIKAAGVHDNDQDYWKDLQSRANGGKKEIPKESHALDADEPTDIKAGNDSSIEHVKKQGEAVDEIKGISEDAQVSLEPGIRRPGTETGGEKAEESDTVHRDKGKGKGKA